MRMAAPVVATKVPSLAAMAASTAVGNASIGRTAAAAQVAAPVQLEDAAAGPSSATAQGSNSWLRHLHQVGYASTIMPQIGLLSHCDESQPVFFIGCPVCCLLAVTSVLLGFQQQPTVCPHHALTSIYSVRRTASSGTGRRL